MQNKLKKINLFRDEIQEARLKKQVLEQRDKIQNAVDQFNKLRTAPLQPDELAYFLNGGHEWMLVRWQDSQTVPTGFARDKYLEILQKPDFIPVLNALKACNGHVTVLYELADNGVIINEKNAAKFVDQNSVYLEGAEIEVYEDLKTIIRLLEKYKFIQHNEFRLITPVNLNVTGLRFIPYMDEKYQLAEVRQLKQFIRQHIV